jgi:ankyrin repeat protein
MKRLINSSIQKNIQRIQLEQLSPLEITLISKLQSHDLNIDSIKELLDQGVDPNIRHPHLFKIISNIIKRENGYEILDLLLQYKLNPNLTDPVKKNTLLHVAVDIMNIKVIKKLLQYNASIDIRNNKLQSPLFRAILNTVQNNLNDKIYLPIIELLLENNANPNFSDNDIISPLHIVAMFNKVDIAKLLLKFKVFVNIIDGRGNTPLMYACDKNHVEIVKLLIPLSRGSKFLSGLQVAIESKHLDVIKLFFESDNFSELDNYDILELMTSIVENFLESLTDEDLNILKWLISYMGGNYFENIIQNHIYILTELIYIYSSGVNKLEFIIDLGINVDTINPETGDTSLIISAKNQYTGIEIVKCLIEHSNDKSKLINTENIQGETPLILFTNFSDDIIKYLIDNGGNINYKNKFGETFFMHACISSFDITYLINKGANINNKSLTEETPLIWAIKDYNEQNVQILLENNAEVNNYVFSIALETDNASILRLLSEYIIDNNIDIDSKYHKYISQYTSENRFKWENACKTKDEYEIQKYKNLFNINESNIAKICVQLNDIQKDMIDYKQKNIDKCINTDNLNGDNIHDIYPENFYSFKQNDITYCEDINTLFKVLKSYTKRQPPKQAENPYTGKQIPNDIIIDIEERYALYNQISTGKKYKDDVRGPTFKDLLLNQLIMFYNIIKNLTSKEIFILSSEIHIKKFIEELMTLKINDKNIFEQSDFEKISLNQDLDQVKYLLIQLLLSKIVVDKFKYTENNVIVYPTRESIQTLWNKIFNSSSIL